MDAQTGLFEPCFGRFWRFRGFRWVRTCCGHLTMGPGGPRRPIWGPKRGRPHHQKLPNNHGQIWPSERLINAERLLSDLAYACLHVVRIGILDGSDNRVNNKGEHLCVPTVMSRVPFVDV